MRYYGNDQHFVSGGPIFIYLGGEWTISPGSLMGGQIYDMAAEHGGYLLYTEHRYYGYSYPTNDFTTANLKYLSVEQALADLAAFIRGLKNNPIFIDSKVVVVGGSYSATMATWARSKYPDLIDAAYASSAPLLALDDYKQYFEVVGLNIQLESPECWDVISEGTTRMNELYQTDAGITELSSLINSCKRLKSYFPYKDHFFNQIANLFAGTVQYAQPGQIKAECQKMLNKSGDSLAKLAAYVRDTYGGCIGDYEDLLYWYAQTGLSESSYRTWFYQTCSEFGFFQTGNSTEQPFGVNWFSTVSHSMCADAFGSQFNKENILASIDNTNRNWGALKPNVTKVISIHGSVDPWHAIGLLEDLHEEAPAILVPGYSHCADLSSISSSDSEAMRNAKQTAKDLIAKWIS